MKNILTILACMAFGAATALQAQNYSVKVDEQTIEIAVDLSSVSDAVIITRSVVSDDRELTSKASDLQLVGDFVYYENGDLVLDFTKNIYRYVPFAPGTPAYLLNNVYEPNGEGLVTISTTSNALSPGGGNYSCQCGTPFPDNNDGPGGCVSNLSQDLISCIKDHNSSCTKGCVGSLIDERGIITSGGGGVLLSVPHSRNLFYHQL